MKDAARNRIVDGATLDLVAEKLLLTAVASEFVDCAHDYVAGVAHLVLVERSKELMSPRLRSAIFEAAKYALTKPPHNDVVAICELCNWVISEKLEPAEIGTFLLESFEGQSHFDDHELKAMLDLASTMRGYVEIDFDAQDFVRDVAIASIQSSIEDDIGGYDLLYSVDEADYETATEKISELIDERLSEVGLAFDRDARKEILGVLSVKALLDAHYSQNDGDPDGLVVAPQSTHLIDEIDELFRRDDL